MQPNGGREFFKFLDIELVSWLKTTRLNPLDWNEAQGLLIKWNVVYTRIFSRIINRCHHWRWTEQCI
jgi:hypothetical protein